MGGFQSAFALLIAVFRALTEHPGYGVGMWFLSGIFVWSGLVKLRRPALAAMAMVDFRVIRRAVPQLGFMLGAAETLLAVMLALHTRPRLFLLVAALLLWVFTFLIGRSLWFGERFACFCFGDAESKLSAWTLARTGTLAMLASILALAPVPDEVNAVLDKTSTL